ncbi:hypothetical protein ACFBZI_11600 [Moraxella sp. ZJ142]|uniref:hypothetical protein n=1 Tax=Moraxella marmotae TaxID=3344520 RepID=UPI0035D46A29
MGQRTQMVVCFTGVNQDGEKAQQVYFSHHQWGFAKVMPINIMQICNNLIYSDKHYGAAFRPSASYTEKATFQQRYQERLDELNIESCFLGSMPAGDNYEKYIVTMNGELNMQKLAEMFKQADNDDGYCFVQIVDNGREFEVGFAFVHGYQDVKINQASGKAKINFCSAKEYVLKYENSYGVSEFMPIFEQYCELFEIVDISEQLNATQTITNEFGFTKAKG